MDTTKIIEVLLNRTSLHLETCARIAEEIVQISPWQSIETAPKDETVIFLLESGKCSSGFSNDANAICMAIAWMPLPKPPKDAS